MTPSQTCFSALNSPNKNIGDLTVATNYTSSVSYLINISEIILFFVIEIFSCDHWDTRSKVIIIRTPSTTTFLLGICSSFLQFTVSPLFSVTSWLLDVPWIKYMRINEESNHCVLHFCEKLLVHQCFLQ